VLRDKGRFLIETHLRTGRPIAQLAAAHGVHRSWLYKLLARYRRDGEAGLEARSRRPHHSPARIADRHEEAIVALRKELTDAGFDAGAVTIQSHLARRAVVVPSASTIWRVLKARGFVTPQPHKRPKSSYRRFVAELPNECWQADVTHVVMADGAFLEVLNIIDDHSRVCVASQAFVRARSPDVVRTLHRAAEKWGYPESFLTDNGAIFTASTRGGVGSMEPELLSLGIRSKHSRPYHPQTCGKVERFHQTLKRHLAKQEPPDTKKQLQAQLARFVDYYNDIRPTAASGGELRPKPSAPGNARGRGGRASTAMATASVTTRSTPKAR
jgi:transposase InsO family protein